MKKSYMTPAVFTVAFKNADIMALSYEGQIPGIGDDDASIDFEN